MTYEYMAGMGTPPPEGKTAQGEQTPAAKGASAAVAAIAVEAGEEEEDRRIPFQETPDGGAGGTWLQEYSTHITIVSTAIGLLTFFGWLALRQRN